MCAKMGQEMLKMLKMLKMLLCWNQKQKVMAQARRGRSKKQEGLREH
jgi:hypothetical protein